MNNENNKVNKTPKPRVIHSAMERVQAVLSLWTERRRPSEICREMSVNAAALSQWEERALTAMRLALEPRTRVSSERGPALSSKLSRLLARHAAQQKGKMNRLEKRLTKLQEPPPTP